MTEKFSECEHEWDEEIEFGYGEDADIRYYYCRKCKKNCDLAEFIDVRFKEGFAAGQKAPKGDKR